MSRCARERERKRGQKEGARVVICTEFDSDRRQYPRLRRGNSSSLWRFCERGKEDKKEGIAGYLRLGLDGHQMRGINGFGDWFPGRFQYREREKLAGGGWRFWRVGPGGRERGERGRGVGWSDRIRERMTWAPGTGTAQVGCCLPFLFFLICFLFFFYIFCICYSIWFKLVSEIFWYSI
jgi:hypothetical protein